MGSVLTRFFWLITLPFFTKNLTPNDFGIVAMIALIGMVAQPIFSLGLSASMGPSYFQCDTNTQKAKTIWTAVLISIISSILLLLIAWAFPEFLSFIALIPSEYEYLLSLSLISVSLTNISSCFSLQLQFQNKSLSFIFISILTSLTSISVSFYLIVVKGLGVEGIIYGQLAGSIINIIVLSCISVKISKPDFDKKIAKDLLKLGLPMVPSFGLLFILMHGNKYILEWHSGLDAVGVYSIGFNLGMAMGIVTSGIAQAWYPFFMGYMNKQKSAEKIFGEVFSIYVILVGAISLLFFVFAWPVVWLFTEPSFQNAYFIVGMISCSYFFIGIYQQILPSMYFKREIAAQSLIQLIVVVVSLPITIWAIMIHGLFGAGLSVAFSHIMLVVFTILWNWFRRKDYLQIQYEYKTLIIAFSIYAIISCLFSMITINTIVESLIYSGFGLLFVIVYVTSQSKIHTKLWDFRRNELEF